MHNIIQHLKGDRVIWYIVFMLSIFSLLAVYSSTGTLAYKYQSGNTEYYLMKHFMILMVGLGLMYLSHNIPYKYYSKVSQLLLYLALILLPLTYFLGSSINEAKRWLVLPLTNITFQPSDLAKLALIMFLARILSKKQESINDFKDTFLPIIGAVVVTCTLIAPSDLSTAVVLFGTSLLLMIIGRIKMKYILFVVLAGTVVGSLVVGFGPRKATYKSRIEAFFKEEKGLTKHSYQSNQSKIAIATGGLFGKGPGKSTQRNFLPHPYSDFIYAIIIEEYGLLGGVTLLFLYMLLLYRGILIVIKSPRAYGALLAIGLCLSIVIQALINMAVTVNLFPVTGLPLPLVSMGGTSVLFTCVAIGIILSVSRNIEELESSKTVNAVI